MSNNNEKGGKSLKTWKISLRHQLDLESFKTLTSEWRHVTKSITSLWIISRWNMDIFLIVSEM